MLLIEAKRSTLSPPSLLHSTDTDNDVGVQHLKMFPITMVHDLHKDPRILVNVNKKYSMDETCT